ncbi:MAG TPA: MurR/RpiR family transcriptional regulator [Thermomicrobiales bacterium]|nr:MurR/RpiR family transcriptional regulator [Thermomicrobiales bacterium]
MNEKPSTKRLPEDLMSGKITALVRGLLPSLVPSEARVARFVLDQPAEVIHLSVSELGGIANTSASTVMRFCQRLGFTGYQDFKIALAQEAIPPLRRLQADVIEGDTPAAILGKVVHAAGEAVLEAASTIDDATFGRVVEALDEADRILVVGVGSSTPIVQDIAYRFLTIGLRAEAPMDVHVQHVTASLLGPKDVCLAISHTGSTRETVATTKSAAAAGARTIALTSFFRSPLTEIAQVVLVTGSKETAFRVEAMASRLAHLAVLDALYVALAVRNRARAIAAQESYETVLTEHRF